MMEYKGHKSRLYLLVIAIVVIGLITLYEATLIANAADDVASGQCGACNWVIDSDGTLSISEGLLDDWEQEPPWMQYSSQITRIKLDGEVVLQTGKYMFANCRNLKYADLAMLNTSSVEDFSYMFYECRKLDSLDLSQFDTSSALNMQGMFYSCQAPVMILSSFETSNVTDMSRMFCGSKTNDLDLSSFDTSNVKDMEGMFASYYGEFLDLSNIDFSNVDNINSFLSGYISELKVGNWSRFSVRPSFGASMHDKETGIDYVSGDTVPAVDGHRFVRYKRETQGYTITDISVDKNVAEWGDYVTFSIDYVGETAPAKVTIDYYLLSPDPQDGFYKDHHAGFSTSYSKGTQNVVENVFDKNTGKGTISLRKQIGSYELTGKYARTKVNMGITSRLSDSAEFYDMASVEVNAPYDNIVADMYYNDSDLLDSLEGLNDGDAVIIRPQSIESNNVPDSVLKGVKHGTSLYYLIKKDCFEAIKGKDVKLLIPLGISYVEMKGIASSADLKDIYLPYIDFSYFFSFDDENMIDCSAVSDFPNNGTLPLETTIRFVYKPVYDVFLEEYNETKASGGDVVYTKNQIEDIISNLKMHYHSNGELVKDASVTVNGNWIDVFINHNSGFTLSDRDPNKPQSFTSSLSNNKFTYNGKKQKPSVTAKPIQGWEICNDFSVYYSNKNSTSVGKYSVMVATKKPGYGSKKLEYTIVPKGTNLTTVSGGKKLISAKWKKQSEKMSTSVITGYQIQVATNKTFTKNATTKTVKGYKTISKKITGLKANKKYYVRVRTYKTVDGKKYYSTWSKIKTVTTKK